jgi:uncharacterized membrane protein YfcA
MLIILIAIITAIVFFNSGKKNGENGIKWSVTGLIGYILGFAIGMGAIGETFISIFIGCISVYLTHLQLVIKQISRLLMILPKSCTHYTQQTRKLLIKQ